MTREAKAQEYARNCAEYNNLPIEVEHLLHTAFIVGYNEREDEEKNPWHKVSEELPKEIKYTENTLQGRREWTESKIVLTIDNHYLPSVDCLKNGEWMKLRTHPRDCDGFPIEYIYWMPIPELKVEQ